MNVSLPRLILRVFLSDCLTIRTLVRRVLGTGADFSEQMSAAPALFCLGDFFGGSKFPAANSAHYSCTFVRSTHSFEYQQSTPTDARLTVDEVTFSARLGSNEQ